ncbi:MAG: glycosyltransferase family 4 protein [bacterium]
MSKVLVLTGDMIGNRMAGPAIRAFEMGRVLAERHTVTLACPEINGVCPEIPADMKVIECGLIPRWPNLNAFDVVILPGSMNLNTYFNIPALVDLYDPFILSSLSRTDKTEAIQHEELEFLRRNLIRGDFFVCATERQKDFWLGMLAATGRVNVRLYNVDQNLEGLIQLAPFGVPAEPPSSKKWTFPGDPNDFWIVWGGGIWDWFDPLTPIQAVFDLNQKGINVSLLFMGTSHPNPQMTQMSMVKKAFDLAEKLGLLDKKIFFSDWIPYSERGMVLKSAHLAVSTHYPHLETRFSFRTRILDYIWAGLPFVCTEGDVLSEWAEGHEAGLAVPPENVQALSVAFQTLLLDKDMYRKHRDNLKILAEHMHWSRVLKPVVDFCENPKRAPDHKYLQKALLSDEGYFVESCENSVMPVGEIFTDGVSQQIICKEGALCRIDLKLATFKRVNNGYGIFELLDSSGAKIVTIPFALASVEDNKWKSFRFGPLSSKPGSIWTVRLSSPDSAPGNAITIWADNACENSWYTINKMKQVGSINYRIFAKIFEGFDHDMPKQKKATFRFPFLRKR